MRHPPKRVPAPRPNPRLEHTERRGGGELGLLMFLGIAIMGILLIIMIARSTCGIGAPC